MRAIRLTVLTLAALAAIPAAMPTAAQETRTAEKDHVSPPATLDQMEWLVGQWTGEGIGGAPAMESWLPPSGGTMVGSFVQETAAEDGVSAIRFTEHLYLMEEEGTLVLRLKHFNADLTGWEEKDDMLTFRLIALEECAAYFRSLTLRCDEREDGRDGLLAAVRMKSEPEVQELIFRFQRMKGGPEVASIGDTDCAAHTTRGYEQCFAERGARVADEHKRYLAAARKRYEDEAEILSAIDVSEAAFERYLKAECGAVYATFGEGSIQNAERILCRNALLARRTHTLWRNFLTYGDSTPPVLPEPSLS